MIAAVVAASVPPGATRTTTIVVSACPAMARSAGSSVPVAPAFAIASWMFVTLTAVSRGKAVASAAGAVATRPITAVATVASPRG